MENRSRFDNFFGDENECQDNCGLCDECIDKHESRIETAYELFREREYCSGAIYHE